MPHHLTVRASDTMQQWEVEQWSAFVFLAALSAEPDTMAELLDALRRYLPDHQFAEDARRVTELTEAEWSEDPWCLVDLVGRTVIAGNDFCLPDPNGAYEVDEDDSTDGFPILWLDTPDDWQFAQATEPRQPTVSARAEAVAGRAPLDTRAVLYGRPLLSFLAAGLVAAAAEGEGSTDADPQETIRRIHAQWLMTARDDLGGRSPRQVLLAHRRRVTRDLEHRALQWSRQGHAPPALKIESAAYRFGGFGTAEVVLYFEMIRAILAHAWRRVEDGPGVCTEVLVERLAEGRDQWLDAPHEEDDCGLTPREQIDSERRRVPMIGAPTHLDCDCPICQAELDGKFGPMFMWFDGHHLELEDEFAFSLTESRDEWEADHADDQRLAEAMDGEQAVGESSEPDNSQDDSLESVWQSTSVQWDQALSADAPRELAPMGIGFLLAEIVADLQQRSGGKSHLEALNRSYKEFRTAGSAVVAQSAAVELGQQLEEVAHHFPELVPKSADLQSHLDEVVRHMASAPPDR